MLELVDDVQSHGGNKNINVNDLNSIIIKRKAMNNGAPRKKIIDKWNNEVSARSSIQKKNKVVIDENNNNSNKISQESFGASRYLQKNSTIELKKIAVREKPASTSENQMKSSKKLIYET